MEPELYFIVPFALAGIALAAINITLVILRLTRHPTQADDVARRLEPLMKVLRLGGRSDLGTQHRRA